MRVMNPNMRMAIGGALLLLVLGGGWFVYEGVSFLHRARAVVSNIDVSSVAGTVTTSSTPPVATSSSVSVSRGIPQELVKTASTTVRVVIEKDSASWEQYGDTHVKCHVVMDRVSVQPSASVSAYSAESMNRRIASVMNELALRRQADDVSETKLADCIDAAGSKAADDRYPSDYTEESYTSAEVGFHSSPYVAFMLRHVSDVSDAAGARQDPPIKYLVFDVRTGKEVQVTELVRSDAVLALYRGIAKTVLEARDRVESQTWRQDPVGWNDDIFKSIETVAHGSDQQATALIAQPNFVLHSGAKYGLDAEGLVIYFPPGVITTDMEGAWDLRMPISEWRELAVPELRAAWAGK